MDNFDFASIPPVQHDEEPIPWEDDEEDKSPSISHAPLNLGGSSGNIPKVTSQPEEAPKPAPKPAATAQTNKSQPAAASSSMGRITGVKTFFTKLHAGGLDFLDQQINDWLRANPGITIKRTNTVTGMVVAKKTEPNIIITIWY